MILCLRTVRVPADQRRRFLEWIDENAELRRQHGILAELVLATSPRQNPAKTLRPTDDGVADPEEVVVLTAWPDHDTFDAWIDTPDRDRLTASPTHQAVSFRPLVRYDVIGGYLADALVRTTPTGGQP
ncbi:MAG: antibiotic biosynthesis monooxygenase [Actinobacteria bacterium]|nr:antibiotic biosynthesis monooxygenase [Actinomycetota bacterium]